jgi:hypothetical protein
MVKEKKKPLLEKVYISLAKVRQIVAKSNKDFIWRTVLTPQQNSMFICFRCGASVSGMNNPAWNNYGKWSCTTCLKKMSPELYDAYTFKEEEEDISPEEVE